MSGVKTFSNETSERYALALFELGEDNSELENLEKNIVNLNEICQKNFEFKNFLKNPTHSIEVQKKLFTEIAKILKFDKTLKNFLQLIIKKRRINFLDKILEKFIMLCSKKKGRINATLISSKDLSQEEKETINSEISKAINGFVDFTYKTDKSLISGIRVQVGSLLIDTSISNKLKRIKQSIIEN